MSRSPDSAPTRSFAGERRLALIVATQTYIDQSLRQLRAPARDVKDLRSVLADPEVGAFEVSVMIDRPAHEIKLAIQDFLDDRRTDDLLLIYLTCHGLIDIRRRLFFAARDTRKNRLAATGVEAQWLLQQLDDCRARRQVVILDCCFSGAFANVAKGDSDLGIGERLHGSGRGRVVLTASRGSEYSFEGEPVAGSEMPGSVFTGALVQGIRSGAADLDRDGFVSVDDAYDYAFDKLRAIGAQQTPQRWLYGAEGDIFLARSPAGAPLAPLTESLQDAPPASTERSWGTFGRFRLDKLLKTRDRAQYYRGYDTLARRAVTVEILPPELSAEASVRERFLSEAARISSLAEPHLVPVWHSGEHEGRLFAVLPPQDGKQLTTALRGGRSLAQDAAVAVVENVAAALDALHGSGIVNLDVRPDSVFLAKATGSASLHALSAARFATTDDSSVRDVAYAAPERLRGSQVDKRIDVYALTCLLYECLTGQPPYPGETSADVVSGHLIAALPRPTDCRSSIAAPLNGVIARGLAKDKAARYPSASALAAAARAAITPVPISAPVTPDRPRHPFGRLLTKLFEIVRPPATKIFGGWPTVLLRLAVALGPLALAGLWILCAFWAAATQMRKPGDLLDFSPPRIANGLIILPGFVSFAALIGLFGYALGMAYFYLTPRGRRGSRADAQWEAALIGAWVGALFFVFITLFLLPMNLIWMLEHRVVSFTDGNWVIGLGVAVAGILIGLLSLSCALVLGQRTIRVSDRFADRYFPQLVGAAALIATAVVTLLVATTNVDGSARWALFVSAWAVAWVCLSCLVVEFGDRASSLASYMTGAAMTLAAGGGSVIAFALL